MLLENLSVKIKEGINCFITKDGYVYKLINGKEIIITPFMDRTKKIYVKIESEKYLLVNLMVKYFDIEHRAKDKFFYKKTKENYIPLCNITIIKHNIKDDLKKKESLLLLWKCNIKASSANARSKDFISGYDVLRVLDMYQFKCVYCASGISYSLWHLDHFTPISRGGLNKIENLVPTCHRCNTMKNDLDGHEFYKMCIKISESYLWKPIK